MGLSVNLMVTRPVEVYSRSITHNLGEMAQAAGIYKHLWRPEELGIRYARDLIEPLTEGLQRLKKDPDYYKPFDAPNGWGVYDDFVQFVEGYLAACIENPDAVVEAER